MRYALLCLSSVLPPLPPQSGRTLCTLRWHVECEAECRPLTFICGRPDYLLRVFHSYSPHPHTITAAENDRHSTLPLYPRFKITSPCRAMTHPTNMSGRPKAF